MIGNLYKVQPREHGNSDILNSLVVIIKEEETEYTFRAVRFGSHMNTTMYKTRIVEI